MRRLLIMLACLVFPMACGQELPEAAPSDPTIEVSETPSSSPKAASRMPDAPAINPEAKLRNDFCQLAQTIERNYKRNAMYPGLKSDVQQLVSYGGQLPDIFDVTAYGLDDTLFGSNPVLSPKKSFFQLRYACEEFG